MRSMRVDSEPPIRIDTYDQLVTYMDGSAGTVGRIMAALLGVPPDHPADLGRLGVAFSSRTSSATCARTAAWTASTCRPRTASASASPTPI